MHDTTSLGQAKVTMRCKRKKEEVCKQLTHARLLLLSERQKFEWKKNRTKWRTSTEDVTLQPNHRATLSRMAVVKRWEFIHLIMHCFRRIECVCVCARRMCIILFESQSQLNIFVELQLSKFGKFSDKWAG